ncbi:MAG: oligosaccharide flippase family protein [Caldilinea sp.]|nr:oligosaccharide flippase family protein [Caldilinea sp.]MCW5841167.1 oligosaccharide flippase family protein [Caldilinea sp.]
MITVAEGSVIARTAIRNAFWSTLGNYATQLLGFGATLLLTRLLAPEIFGAFALASFWFGLLNLRNKMGLQYSALQPPETDGALLGTFFRTDLLVTLTSLAVMGVAAQFFVATGRYSAQMATAMMVLMLAEAVTVMTGPYWLALERNIQVSRTTLVGLGAALVAYPLAVGVALLNGGIVSLLVINVVTYSLAAIGVAFMCRLRLPEIFRIKWRYDRALGWQLLRRGVQIGLAATILTIVVQQYDNFLIGTFVSETTLGYYDRAYRIASWPNLLLTIVIGRIGLLTLAKVQKNPLYLAHTLRMAFWVIFTAGIPLTLTLVFAAPEVVQLLYGARYAESVPFLRFLACSNFVWVLVSLAFGLSVALNHPRRWLWISLAQGVTIVLIGTPLTLALGVNGTMLGVAATMLVALALCGQYLFANASGLDLRETVAAPAIALSVAVGGLLGEVWALPINLNPVLRLAIIGSTALLLYLGMMLLLRRNEMRDRLLYLRERWREGEVSI